MKKMFINFICFIVIFSCVSTTVFALDEPGISTYANNTASTNTVFVIIDGVAYATISYNGYDGITTNAVITTKIQKRFLLFFWQDVDGAYWTDYASGVYYSNSHSISVSSGTYRVQVEYTIYGSGGEADVITDEIEAKK